MEVIKKADVPQDVLKRSAEKIDRRTKEILDAMKESKETIKQPEKPKADK